ncbi:MAG: hypothetical protein ACOX5S_03745 [Patescibacteria group bacterium]|jgi:hypothetical protein
MENLSPEEKQLSHLSFPPVPEKAKKPIFLYLALGLVILALIGEGIYWFKLKKENQIITSEPSQQTTTPSLSSEQQLYADIIKIYEPYGGENSEIAQDILKNLEKANELDPNKFPENLDQYEHYRITVGWLVGVYYASGDSPENRNQKILEVLAQIRELARPNPFFDEKDWEVE